MEVFKVASCFLVHWGIFIRETYSNYIYKCIFFLIKNIKQVIQESVWHLEALMPLLVSLLPTAVPGQIIERLCGATRSKIRVSVQLWCTFCPQCDAESWRERHLIECYCETQTFSSKCAWTFFSMICFSSLKFLPFSLPDPLEMKTSASAEWSSLRAGRNTHITPTWLCLARGRGDCVFIFLRVCLCNITAVGPQSRKQIECVTN